MDKLDRIFDDFRIVLSLCTHCGSKRCYEGQHKEFERFLQQIRELFDVHPVQEDTSPD